MGAPQVILIVIMAMGTGITIQSCVKDGSWRDIVVDVAAKAITLTLLIWGGFFG